MIIRYKIFENVQYSKKILKKLDIPESDSDYIKLKNMLGNNLGYLGKFTEWLYVEEDPLYLIKSVYDKLTSSNVRLDKPITNFESAKDLYQYIRNLEIGSLINKLIKSIPSRNRNKVNTDTLKEFLKDNIDEYDNIKNLFSKFGGSPRFNRDEKMVNFIKSALKNLKVNNAESVPYLEDELVYKDDFVLILHIKSHKRACELFTPEFCISDPNDPKFWRNYTSNFQKQYFIWDFTKDPTDKESFMGLTIKPDGTIRAFQNKTNNPSQNFSILSSYKKYLTPYSKEYIKSEVNDIKDYIRYGILDEVKKEIKSKEDIKNEYLKISVKYNQTEVFKYFIELGADPSIENDYCFINAIKNDNLEIVKMLINDQRVNIRTNNNFGLKWAKKYDKKEILELLE
jgi:hypothetical protein